MGKKRRLISAKGKFGGKHSNHPRFRLAANEDEEVIPHIAPPAPVVPEVVTPVVTATPTPEVIPVIEETAEEIPVIPAPVIKRSTPRKKSRRRSAKKSTT